MRVLLAILGLALLPQEAGIRERILKLEDDKAETRDQAQKALVALGEAALPLLKQAVESANSSGELKLRAADTIREIEWTIRAAKVYRTPPRITVKAAGTMLREILDEIARQAAVKIDSRAVDEFAKITLDLPDATLYQAMDQICQGQEGRTWEARDDGIRLLNNPHVPYPTEYSGPFRTRVQSLNLERSNDFKTRSAAVTVTLDADCERTLKPLKNVELEISKASDDAGSVLEVVPVNPNLVVLRGAPGARLVVRGGVTPDNVESVRSFTLKNLAGTATKISLEGVARFVFPLEAREILFDKPAAAETRDMGDTTIRMTRSGTPETWTLSFHKAPASSTPAWAQSIFQRFDPDSFTVTDQDGAQVSVNLRPMNYPGRARVDPTSETAIWYQGDLQRVSTKAIKDVKFKFADQLIVKSVPFKFISLDLP